MLAISANMARMQVMTQHEMKLWLQERLGPRRSGRRKELAEFLDVSADKITRWANTDPGKESHIIPADVFQRMQVFFGDDAETMFDGTTRVPLMGYLGAGAEIEPDFEQVPPDGLDDISVPFPVPDDMIAFKVRGTSMLPVYRPDAIIIVYREQRKPIESFYGLEAAVRTTQGRRYIKTINRGALPRTVNLISWNDPAPIEGVGLEWIGEIFAVLPPAAARLIAKKGGIQGRLPLRD